jgi:membrane protein implicated in regulation of membrane protease activity
MLEMKPMGVVLVGTGLGISVVFGGASCVPTEVACQIVAFVGLPIVAAGLTLWRLAGRRVREQRRMQLSMAAVS